MMRRITHALFEQALKFFPMDSVQGEMTTNIEAEMADVSLVKNKTIVYLAMSHVKQCPNLIGSTCSFGWS